MSQHTGSRPTCVGVATRTLDETWAKANRTPTRGRSPRGARLLESVPCGRWETTTFLGVLRSTGFVAPVCVDGAINGRVFLARIRQHLARELRPGEVVVLDNLSSHKGKTWPTRSRPPAPKSVTCRPTART